MTIDSLRKTDPYAYLQKLLVIDQIILTESHIKEPD